MNDLPKFDDVTAYGVTEAREQELWKKEVHRLVKVANSTEPARFEAEDEWLGDASEEGYTRLHKLSVQLQLALYVCVHDNELILMESEPDVANYQHYQAAHKRLIQEFNPEEGMERYKRSLRFSESNDKCFHSLVDYITGTMIRVLLRTLDGDFWTNNCVTTVAKFAAKLKILVFNLTTAAITSLEGTNEVIRRMSHEHTAYKMLNAVDQGPVDEKTSLGKRREVLRRDVVGAGAQYFLTMDLFHHSISLLLLSVGNDLGADERTGLAADIFETSVVIYETGVSKRRTLLCQERHGTIGATANRGETYCASVAAEICTEVWESLKTNTLNLPSQNSTTISWCSTSIEKDDNEETKRVRLQSMNDVVSALVPYLTVCGEFASILDSLSSAASTMADPANPVRPFVQDEILGRFMISTSAYEKDKDGLINDQDVSNVSNVRISQSLRANERISPKNNIQTGLDKISTWIIDEKAIIIPYKLYAWGVLAGCSVFVAGGLAIGLVVETRIPGVDPFNISVFCWAIAGFIILFAKSIRVENWPWKDFLRGRVICRSVSEVHSVTRIEPQQLLSVLLWFEGRMNNTKRGPFHTSFVRKAEDGFSIDIPLLNSTMMEAGIIFIKVETNTGPALVSIAARRWSGYDTVTPLGGTEGEDRIVCRDFIEPGSWQDKLNMYQLCLNTVYWYRVYGVFTKEVVFS